MSSWRVVHVDERNRAIATVERQGRTKPSVLGLRKGVMSRGTRGVQRLGCCLDGAVSGDQDVRDSGGDDALLRRHRASLGARAR